MPLGESRKNLFARYSFVDFFKLAYAMGAMYYMQDYGFVIGLLLIYYELLVITFLHTRYFLLIKYFKYLALIK